MRQPVLRVASVVLATVAALAASGCAAEADEEAGSNDAAISMSTDEALDLLLVRLRGASVTFGEQLRFSSPDVTLTLFSESPQAPRCKLRLTEAAARALPRVVPQGDVYSVTKVEEGEDFGERTWTLSLADKKVAKVGPTDFAVICRAKLEAIPTPTMFEQAISQRGVKLELAKTSGRP